MKKIDTNSRNCGLDLLRIMAMIFITIIHWDGYTNITSEQTGIIKLFIMALLTLDLFAINVFVLITGYFMSMSKFKISRLIKVWFEVWIYSVIFGIIGFFINGGQIGIEQVFKIIFPLLGYHYWYIMPYFFLCFIAPYISKALTEVSRGSHLTIIFVIVFLFDIVVLLNPFYHSYNVFELIGSIKGFLWFVILFIIAAYIRKYPNERRYKVSIIGFFASTGILYLLLIMSDLYPALNTVFSRMSIFDKASILALIMSVSLFNIMNEIKIKNNKFKYCISKLSACSFGVYLIQEHTLLRNYIWSIIDKCQSGKTDIRVFIPMICLLFILFILALIIHYIKNVIATKFKIETKLCNLCNRLWDKTAALIEKCSAFL